MGQAASRQAGRAAQKAAKSSGSKSGAPAPRPPPLGRPEADSPEVTEDATKALKQRQQKEQQQELVKNDPYQPPSGPTQHPQADQNTGFFRGGAPVQDPRDVAQEQFLVHQSGGKDKMEEMSPDLLQFLKDSGPLKKKVNKEKTSKRLLRELEKEGGEEAEKLHRFEVEQRQRNDMRLVESIEGHTTPRTTNFFTSGEEEDLNDFGLSDLEIYDLLKRKTVDGQDTAIQSFYKEKQDYQTEAQWSEEERKSHHRLLADTSEFLELPIVIKDDDANYIGAWPQELKEKQSLKPRNDLDIVDESRVKLVLADLVDLQRKQIKKMR